MAKNGLDKWFKQKWVDIGSKRKDGSFAPCGRSKQKKDAKKEKNIQNASHCKSHTDDKRRKGECCQTKKQAVAQMWVVNQLTLKHLQERKKRRVRISKWKFND